MSNDSADSPRESIKVLVRVRPLNSSELEEEAASQQGQGQERAIEILDGDSIKLSKFSSKKVFECCFDSVAGPSSSQADIYRTVKNCTVSVLNGTNSTIFAYGQTGSGKTFSMYGPSSDSSRPLSKTDEGMGIIPRVIHDIFELAHSIEVLSLSVYCSFVQIYNENLYDMLRDVEMASPLTLREDAKKGGGIYKKHGEQGEIYVQGLSEFCVKNIKETMLLLNTAEKNRKIRETTMNLFSSRSHSIFQIFVEQKRVAPDGGEVSLTSKFNLVDLAGSEKWKALRDKDLSDEHVAEMTNINLSLHTLGRCISALASRAMGKSIHVPYRDSKLTRLLQDSLGGNARTFLIATISSASANIDESISTLKFADRAKQVMVTATVNEIRPVDHLLVQRLMKEIEYLKKLLKKSGALAPSLGPADPSGALGASRDDRDPRGDQDRPQVSDHTLSLADSMWSRAMTLANTMDGGEMCHEVGAEDGETDRGAGLGLGLGWGKDTALSLGKGYQQSPNKGTEAEKERIREENKVLKREINALKARHLHDLRNEEKKMKVRGEEEREDGNIYQQTEAAYNSLMQRETATWQHVERLQAVMGKFFKFKMEEDDMRSNVSEIFKLLEQSRKQHVTPLPSEPRLQLPLDYGKSKGSSRMEISPAGPSSAFLLPLSSPSSHTFPRGGSEAFRADKKEKEEGSSSGGAYRLRGMPAASGPAGARNRIVYDSNGPTDPLANVVEEAEKELRILKELRETKNKIKQQQELLDWVREKDLKIDLKGGS